MDEITIYVRLPKNKDKTQRVVTFKMGERIPQDAVLALGGAIDGGQALFEIDHPFQNQALLRLERHLVILFRANGYAPQFA